MFTPTQITSHIHTHPHNLSSHTPNHSPCLPPTHTLHINHPHGHPTAALKYKRNGLVQSVFQNNFPYLPHCWVHNRARMWRESIRKTFYWYHFQSKQMSWPTRSEAVYFVIWTQITLTTSTLTHPPSPSPTRAHHIHTHCHTSPSLSPTRAAYIEWRGATHSTWASHPSPLMCCFWYRCRTSFSTRWLWSPQSAPHAQQNQNRGNYDSRSWWPTPARAASSFWCNRWGHWQRQLR